MGVTLARCSSWQLAGRAPSPGLPCTPEGCRKRANATGKCGRMLRCALRPCAQHGPDCRCKPPTSHDLPNLPPTWPDCRAHYVPIACMRQTGRCSSACVNRQAEFPMCPTILHTGQAIGSVQELGITADKRLPDRNTSVCFERTAAAPGAQLSNFPEEDEAGVKYFRGIQPPFQVQGTPASAGRHAQQQEFVCHALCHTHLQLPKHRCDRLDVTLDRRSCSAMTPCGGRTFHARCSHLAHAPMRAPDAAAACCSIRTTYQTASRRVSATTAGRFECQTQSCSSM
jgi:hypothetical protein